MSDAKPPEKAAEAGKPAGPARPRLVIPAGQEPVYSNVVRIAHTPSEMVFDFGRVLPGENEILIKTRVMMSPLSAKLLQRALADNLAKYETIFGEIKVPQGKSLADDLFRSPPHTDPPTKPEGSE
jgi:hypothetical protein